MPTINQEPADSSTTPTIVPEPSKRCDALPSTSKSADLVPSTLPEQSTPTSTPKSSKRKRSQPATKKKVKKKIINKRIMKTRKSVQDSRFDRVDHVPGWIAPSQEKGKKSARRNCKMCTLNGIKDSKTASCCTKCNVPLHFLPDKNCFAMYHERPTA